MNLLVVCPTFYPHKGGVESLFDDLAELLVEHGHQVTVLAEADGRSDSLSWRRGVEVQRIRYPNITPTPRALLAYLRDAAALLVRHGQLVRRRRIATVCIARFDEKSRYVLALRCVRTFRIVLYLHGGELRWFSRDSTGFRRTLQWAFRMCDEVVAVSEDLKNEAIRFSPRVARKIRVIPNAVDLTAIRAQPACDRARKYVVFVGRLEPVKNVKTIIVAFARVCAEKDDIDLLLVGTGSQEEEIAQQVAECGLSQRVHLLGAQEREEVFALMKGAELIVLASLAEAHPIVVIEALAAGKIVLGSNVKGIRDVIVDGVNGSLFDPLEEHQLARLILKYVGNTRARAGLEANIARLDLTPYDIRARLEQHLDVLGCDRQ